MSAISVRPAFNIWMLSPSPGTVTTTTVSTIFLISNWVWPAPTLSTIIISLPEASSTLITSLDVGEIPPRRSLAGRLRIKTSGSRLCSSIRRRSPRSDPPEIGLVGSMQSRPSEKPWLLKWVIRELIRVLFPTPGGPVMPITKALPVYGSISLTICALFTRSSRKVISLPKE